jgi:alpha-galactosidase
MLVVGMYGKGNVALGGCTDTQYKTHFALWCMMNSPLMIGCDIRAMNDATRAILTNKDMIAINQDGEGRQPYTIMLDSSRETRAYVKPLNNGDYAIGLFNLSDETRNLSLQLWDLGLPSAAGYGFELYDVWAHAEAGLAREHLTMPIEACDCRVYRARLKKL